MIGGCVIATKQIVLASYGQWTDSILNEVIVDVYSTVIYVSGQYEDILNFFNLCFPPLNIY